MAMTWGSIRQTQLKGADQTRRCLSITKAAPFLGAGTAVSWHLKCQAQATSSDLRLFSKMHSPCIPPFLCDLSDLFVNFSVWSAPGQKGPDHEFEGVPQVGGSPLDGWWWSPKSSHQVPKSIAAPMSSQTLSGHVGSMVFKTVMWVCLKIGYIPNYSHLKTG